MFVICLHRKTPFNVSTLDEALSHCKGTTEKTKTQGKALLEAGLNFWWAYGFCENCISPKQPT